MKKRWVIFYTFNSFTHSKSFAEYDKAMNYYYILEENGYNPSIHES